MPTALHSNAEATSSARRAPPGARPDADCVGTGLHRGRAPALLGGDAGRGFGFTLAAGLCLPALRCHRVASMLITNAFAFLHPRVGTGERHAALALAAVSERMHDALATDRRWVTARDRTAFLGRQSDHRAAGAMPGALRLRLLFFAALYRARHTDCGSSAPRAPMLAPRRRLTRAPCAWSKVVRQVSGMLMPVTDHPSLTCDTSETR